VAREKRRRPQRPKPRREKPKPMRRASELDYFYRCDSCGTESLASYCPMCGSWTRKVRNR
jgi:rubrerythrin